MLYYLISPKLTANMGAAQAPKGRAGSLFYFTRPRGQDIMFSPRRFARQGKGVYFGQPAASKISYIIPLLPAAKLRQYGLGSRPLRRPKSFEFHAGQGGVICAGGALGLPPRQPRMARAR